ncbi:MAG: hypothetical protein ABH856_00115 [Patescibacteria group bacterium]|nr:hypothetical protein [Patescibacteria group bacterium]
MSFLKDLRELLLKEPKHYCPRQDNVNSDYGSFIYRCKNCYMAFAGNYMEDCLYMHLCDNSKDCCDCTGIWEGELCYECIDGLKLYNCNFCQDTGNSRDCFLCDYCMNCQDCFGCSGLRRVKYYIFNKKYSKDEYFKKAAELKKRFFENRGKVLAEFEKIKYEEPRCLVNVRCDEDVYGSYNSNCKNCYEVYDADECEDCLYLYRENLKLKDCCDCTHASNSELCYDSMSMDKAYNCNHCFWIVNSSDCEHCYCAIGCDHCFGCHNIKHKKYHILNRPYEKDEYFKKVAEIKEELKRDGLANEYLIGLALEDVQKEIGDCIE